MARLFTCGFEENDTTTATMWTVFTGGTIISTGTPHSGTFHLNLPTNVIGPRRDLSTNNTNTFYTRVYWKPATLPTSGTTTVIFGWRDAGNASVFQILYVRATGVLRINNVKATTTYDGTQAVSAGTYYRIETQWVPSATVGTITCNIYVGDSTTLFDTIVTNAENTGTGVNTFTTSSTVGENNGQTFNLDDIAFNDSTGGFQNTFPGPGNIALINPTSDVSVSWTKAGSAPAGTNFGGVAEVPGTPDDGTTFNEDSGTTNVDRLGMSSLPAGVPGTAVITLVDVYARCQAAATSQSLILRLWDHLGASTDGPTVSLGNAVWNFTSTAQHLVFNGATYTKANVNSFNVGYKGNAGISAKRVTSVWVNVEWTPAVAGGPLMGPLNQYDWPNPAPKPPYLENRSWIGILSYYSLDQFFGDPGQPPAYEMFNPPLGPPRPNLGFVNSSFIGLQQTIPQGQASVALPPRGPQPINVGFIGQSPLVLLTFAFPRPFYFEGQGGDPNPRGPVRNAALGTWINPSTVLPSPPAGGGDANWVPTWMPRRGR